MRKFVVCRPSDLQAVLVVDETGDLKKGSGAPECSVSTPGMAGRIESAQVAVYLTYAAAGATR